MAQRILSKLESGGDYNFTTFRQKQSFGVKLPFRPSPPQSAWIQAESVFLYGQVKFVCLSPPESMRIRQENVGHAESAVDLSEVGLPVAAWIHADFGSFRRNENLASFGTSSKVRFFFWGCYRPTHGCWLFLTKDPFFAAHYFLPIFCFLWPARFARNVSLRATTILFFK